MSGQLGHLMPTREQGLGRYSLRGAIQLLAGTAGMTAVGLTAIVARLRVPADHHAQVRKAPVATVKNR